MGPKSALDFMTYTLLAFHTLYKLQTVSARYYHREHTEPDLSLTYRKFDIIMKTM